MYVVKVRPMFSMIDNFVIICNEVGQLLTLHVMVVCANMEMVQKVKYTVGWGIIGMISTIVAINVICLTLTSFYWIKKLLFDTIHAKRIARIKALREHDQLMECLAKEIP